MPKLGEFIGALLCDAARARVRADLEAVKIADAYSRHLLLKHLPVPRFRLPDITVDVPVLVSDVEGLTEGGTVRPFGEPTSAEIRDVVRGGLRESKITLPRAEVNNVPRAAIERAKELFESSSWLLLSPALVSEQLATTVADIVKAARRGDVPAEQLQELETAIRTSMTALLSTKLVESPSLQAIVTSREIKSHADNESIVRVRLTITEEAYEVITRDDGQGYFLTPE
jgi:hypothetical protein